MRFFVLNYIGQKWLIRPLGKCRERLVLFILRWDQATFGFCELLTNLSSRYLYFFSLFKFFSHRPDNRLLVGKASSSFGCWADHPEPKDFEGVEDDAGVLGKGDGVVVAIHTGRKVLQIQQFVGWKIEKRIIKSSLLPNKYCTYLR